MRTIFPKREPLPDPIPEGSILLSKTGHAVEVTSISKTLYQVFHIEDAIEGDGTFTRDDFAKWGCRLIKEMPSGD